MKYLLAFATCLLPFTTFSALPNLTTNLERPLRYQPDGTDFVIENGAEFFNRPLYGTNTAFRVDGGDKPEFVLFFPGRAGNLRLGVQTEAGVKWLADAERTITRYRPGSLRYEIHDPLLNGGVLQVVALPFHLTEGLLVRAELTGGTGGVELVWAFGGASGERGARNGDIGCEKVPVSQFFQVKPESCKGNELAIEGETFTLRSKMGRVLGVMPPGAKLAIGDGAKWASAQELLASSATELPVLTGRVALPPGTPILLGLQRVAMSAEKPDATLLPPYAQQDLAGLYEGAEAHRRELAGQVVVETPDPFINAAAAALNVAADAVWDEKEGAVMHGGVAWRVKLLGWRGPYCTDELGWHDRARRHLQMWAGKQNQDAIPAGPIAQDESMNLARNEPVLHSNGDLSKSHYDMNLVYIDALFRHLLWTGDLDFARKVWPVIERHLAWEQRLFRRPFGADKLPLYEAYCCIWASDDLQYSGGGVTHATAFNYYHHKMAARLAGLLGVDATPYAREAEAILEAMRRELWLPERGAFAEFKDLLGLQRPHPAAALWTLYHTLDSEVPTPFEAWQMTRQIDTEIAHLPLRGPGLPKGDFFTLPTTNWMPYTWSTNNVVMAEVAHTALAYWQAGRAVEAFSAFKGCLLDSMFTGLCPGNVGMCTQFDMARREAQRDFGDGSGATSRALIEGLFGVHPDALAGELRIQPGFPAEWEHAALRHPDVNVSYQRRGLTETYVVESKFSKPMKLRLKVAALRDTVASVTVNGLKPALKISSPAETVGTPRIELTATGTSRYEIVIAWRGAAPASTIAPSIVVQGEALHGEFGTAKLLGISDPQKALSQPFLIANSMQAKATGALGHHVVFNQLQQGMLTWWSPLALEIRAAAEILPSETQDADHLRFRVRNNLPTALAGEAVVQVGERALKIPFTAPALGESEELALPAGGLLPGTNRVTLTGNKTTIEGTVTNWQLTSGDTKARWEEVQLEAVLNDRVTQIFQNQYRTPRSPYCSLAIPTNGLGSWVHTKETFDVSDAGLRTAAGVENRFTLPSGIPFQTPGPGEAKNIAFTSQWDNYPREVSVPLLGRAAHVYCLMAGSTNSMQSRCDNGEIVVTYTDGSTERLALENPTNWWPIDQDYFIDDYAFRRPEAIPPRLDLKTGKVRTPLLADFKGRGATVPGGAATVLDLPLNPKKALRSLTVRTLANEVVIGLMSVTLAR